MADPGASDDVFFPVLDESLAWSYSNVDEYLGDAPWASMTMLNWETSKGEPRSKPLSVFLDESWLFMTIDTSWTATRDSDFKVCTVMAATPENELFVLDLWGGQCDENTLIKEVFKMADKWRVPSIRPEVVKQSIALYQNLDSIVKQRATEMVGVDHLPKVVPLRVGQISKEARISALQFRFENGLIKFPLERRMDRHWKELFDQIEGFNPEVKDGGLAKDDHLDTVAMSGAILKGRIARRDGEEEDDRTPEEHILDGDFADEHGTPWAYKLGKIPIELINELGEEYEYRRGPSSRI
jgi:predicted phage terminase large subunit-like protein